MKKKNKKQVLSNLMNLVYYWKICRSGPEYEGFYVVCRFKDFKGHESEHMFHLKFEEDLREFNKAVIFIRTEISKNHLDVKFLIDVYYV